MPLPMPPPIDAAAPATSSTDDPTHLSIPLTLSPHTNLQILIHSRLQTPLIFITTTNPTTSSPVPLGSFVYSLPNRLNPAEPLCTTLYAQPNTVDFATRIAKIVAKRTAKPTYVAFSGDLGGVGRQVEEEMEGLRKAVDAIMGVIGHEKSISTG